MVDIVSSSEKVNFFFLQVLTIEEDKVFDFKYVRHSPRLYTQSDLGSNKDDVKSDGSLRLHVGRIHVVLLYKLLVDLQVSSRTELFVMLSVYLHVLCLLRSCVCACVILFHLLLYSGRSDTGLNNRGYRICHTSLNNIGYLK